MGGMVRVEDEQMVLEKIERLSRKSPTSGSVKNYDRELLKLISSNLKGKSKLCATEGFSYMEQSIKHLAKIIDDHIERTPNATNEPPRLGKDSK